MDQRNCLLEQGLASGHARYYNQKNVASLEGAVVEGSSCDCVFDGAVGVTFLIVGFNCVAEPVERVG